MMKLSELLNPISKRYYYYNGAKVYLNLVPDQILITFRDIQNQDQKTSILKTIDVSDSIFLNDTNQEMISDKYLLITLNRATAFEFSTSVTLDQPEIESVSSVFYEKLPNSKMALTNQVFIEIKKNNGLNDLANLFKAYQVTEHENYGNNIYLLTLANSDSFDSLDAANAFYESGYCEFAEPNFFRSVQTSSFTPNDPYYFYQWHLPKIGADNAWCWTTGQNVTIGIMDVGTNTGHPDLQANFQGSYDPTGLPLGTDGHGTPCTGCALAVGNNNIGVTGVAYSARLHQIRIGYNPSSNPNNSTFNSIDAWVVGGINYAINNNIQIVSASISLGSPSSTVDSRITTYANTSRGGLGGIMLAATGNDSSSQFIGYPASHPDVLAVGASDLSDVRASFSNYGGNVDFVAPGVLITTTKYDGGYETAFGGTSAACPIAAGAVGLMLAVNPGLSRLQVRAEMAKSCDKIGPYQYFQVAYEPSDRTQEVGFGRVNINNFFKTFYGITGDSFFCGSQSQYEISHLPSGLSTTWSSSNSNLPIGSTGLVTNPSGLAGRTILTAAISNPCVEPREKVIVAGSFPEEVWASVQNPNLPLDVTWAGGNNSNQTLSVQNNTVVISEFPSFISFGYAPYIGKSTLFPPDLNSYSYNNQGWTLDNNGVSNVQIISAPSTWQASVVNNNSIWVKTSGDASGTLVVSVQLPCGPTQVTFYIVGVA